MYHLPLYIVVFMCPPVWHVTRHDMYNSLYTYHANSTTVCHIAHSSIWMLSWCSYRCTYDICQHTVVSLNHLHTCSFTYLQWHTHIYTLIYECCSVIPFAFTLCSHTHTAGTHIPSYVCEWLWLDNNLFTVFCHNGVNDKCHIQLLSVKLMLAGSEQHASIVIRQLTKDHCARYITD